MMFRTGKYLFQRSIAQPKPLSMMQPRAMAMFSTSEYENVLVDRLGQALQHTSAAFDINTTAIHTLHEQPITFLYTPHQQLEA